MFPKLIMLHGANGCGESLSSLAEALRPFAGVDTPNLLGHGGRAVPEIFSVKDFAEDIIAHLDQQNIERAFVFGYSFGGYVALYLARHFPHRLQGVCTLAAKYVFDERTVGHFTYLINPERLSRPGNPRQEQLKQIHAPQDWITIANKNKQMFEELGRNPALTERDLRLISVPALVISSDADQLVSGQETIALGKLLRARPVVMFHGQAHPWESIPIKAVAGAIEGWMGKVKVGR